MTPYYLVEVSRHSIEKLVNFIKQHSITSSWPMLLEPQTSQGFRASPYNLKATELDDCSAANHFIIIRLWVTFFFAMYLQCPLIFSSLQLKSCVSYRYMCVCVDIPVKLSKYFCLLFVWKVNTSFRLKVITDSWEKKFVWILHTLSLQCSFSLGWVLGGYIQNRVQGLKWCGPSSELKRIKLRCGGILMIEVSHFNRICQRTQNL